MEALLKLKMQMDGAEQAKSKISGIKDETDKLSKSAENAKNSFNSLKSGLAAGLGMFGISSAMGILSKGTEKFVEGETKLQSLRFAADMAGASYDNLIEKAGELSKKSLFGKTDIIDAQRFALNLGRTEAEANKMVETAMGLSNVTGQDLNTAMMQLSMTYEGSVGRLGKFDGRLKKLTAEQLNNGAAVDILNQKFKRFASVGLDTTAGKIKKMQQTATGLMKILGSMVITVLTPLMDTLGKLLKLMEENKKMFSMLAVGAVAYVAALKLVEIWQARAIIMTKLLEFWQSILNRTMKLNPFVVIVTTIAMAVWYVMELIKKLGSLKNAMTALTEWATNYFYATWLSIIGGLQSAYGQFLVFLGTSMMQVNQKLATSLIAAGADVDRKNDEAWKKYLAFKDKIYKESKDKINIFDDKSLKDSMNKLNKGITDIVTPLTAEIDKTSEVKALTVNITKLVEEMNISTSTISQNTPNTIKDEVVRLLQTAIADSTRLAY